jgi:predicted dehydrogenase
MKKYNWGILAPGHIAKKFATELRAISNARIYAVGSRNLEKAEEFAKEFNAIKYYGSYQALASDPDVDIIYIASPHSFHKEHTLLCLENHKAVLCEKAFSLNLSEAVEMALCANHNNTFLMEAMMVPHQPSYQHAKKLLNSGILGKIKHIQSWFGFNRSPYDMNGRLFNPSLGGGALLDIGIYPVFDILYFLDAPVRILSSAELSSTGVDQTVSVKMDFKDGATASAFASFMTASGLGTDIFCEKGILRLRRLNAIDQWLEIDVPGVELKRMEWNPTKCGLKQEAIEVMKCLDKGRIESKKMPLFYSLSLMAVLEKILKEIGVIYPGRDNVNNSFLDALMSQLVR